MTLADKAPRKGRSNTPNLDRIREADREEHVRLGREAGLSRAQAERHADEEMGED